MAVYISPCDPCEYNYYAVDEFGECKCDICFCPKDEKDEKCWIEQWAKELNEKRSKEQKNE